MIYYFDTNILVTAQRLDFPVETALDFWEWLAKLGKSGMVKIPEAVIGEIGRGNDPLSTWMSANHTLFHAPMTEALSSLPAVLNTYENPMQAGTLEKIQVDACVIAHAHAFPGEATVVTYEQPSKATVGKNKKIPSICKVLGTPCIRFPQFMWLMSDLGKK